MKRKIWASMRARHIQIYKLNFNTYTRTPWSSNRHTKHIYLYVFKWKPIRNIQTPKMKLMTKIDIKNHIDCITQRIDEYNEKKNICAIIKIRMQNNWVIVFNIILLTFSMLYFTPNIQQKLFFSSLIPNIDYSNKNVCANSK